jgi:hypothetical protein
MELEFEYRPAFESLPEMVDHAIDLFNRGWLRLNDVGSVDVRPTEELQSEGVLFADRLEEARFRNFGEIPSAARRDMA